MDGRPWDDASVEREVEDAARPGIHLERDEELDRFDVLPLLVATDGAIDFLGDAIIGVVSLRQRCIMTTFDPDTAAQDPSVLLRERHARKEDGPPVNTLKDHPAQERADSRDGGWPNTTGFRSQFAAALATDSGAALPR